MKLFSRSEVDKQKKAEEWAAFKKLSFFKKLEHIFVYYRSIIFFTVVIVFGVGALLNTMVFNRSKPTFAHITLYGRFTTPIQRQYMEIYLQRYIPDTLANTHEINMENLFIEHGSARSLTGAHAQRFQAQIFAREIDLIIFCGEFFEQIHERGILMDLRQIFTESELAALSGRLQYFEYREYDNYGDYIVNAIPYAARVIPYSMFPQLKDHGNDIYIGIIVNSRRAGNALTVMQGLLAAPRFDIEDVNTYTC